jgi:hypothetical protein
MAKSNTLSKEKEKLPKKTFEEIEAKELTLNEQKKISRSLILRWYESKKTAKLKGFQELLRNASFVERDEIKELIIKNTRAELAKHSSSIDQKELDKRVEAFADEIIRVGEEMGSMDEIVAKYNIQKMEEDLFFKTLDTFGGKKSTGNMLSKFFKSAAVVGALNTLKTESPDAYAKIQKARKEGSYEDVREIMVDSDPTGQLSAKEVDQFFALAITTTSAPKLDLSVGGIYGFITGWIDKVKLVGKGFAVRETAEKANVSFPVVLKFYGKTFSEIKVIDNRLQKNAYLINSKTKKSVQDAHRLKFISEVHALRVHIEEGLNKGGAKLQNDFKRILGKYLDKKDLSDRDKLYILQNTKVEDLRMIQLYELLNASDQDRDRLMFRTLSRIPTMMRAYRQYFGENRDYVNMIREYHVKKTVGSAKRMFSKSAKSWKMDGILKEMDELEAVSKKWNPKMDQFSTDGIISSDEMLGHDQIVKKYQSLVKEATEIMIKEAKQTMGFGKNIDVLRNSRKGKFYTDNIGSMRNAVGDDALKKLFNVTEITDDILKKNGADLIAAYGKKAVALKSMQDITRTRFSVLAETVDNNVATPFTAKFKGKQDLIKGSRERANISKKLDNVEDLLTKPGKIKYGLKRYGLPIALIGFQAYSTFQGKAKGREMAYDLGEAAAGFIPFIGTALDFKAALFGKSLSGRKLGTKERILSGVFGLIGAASDVATVTTGIGYAMRASLGGMRGASRTLKIAKTADNLRDMSAVADVGGVFGGIKKAGFGFGKLFSKAHRAEKVTDAAIAGKAYEQVRLMSKLGVVDDAADLSKIARTADNAKDLDRLNDLRKGVEGVVGGRSFKKIFEAHSLGRTLEIPGLFGRGWLRTKEAFLGMKKVFYKIGVSADVIKQYENSFDALKIAKVKKIEALEALKIAERVKVVELANKEVAFANATKSLKGIDSGYAKMLTDKRILKKGLSKADHAQEIAKLKVNKLEKLKKAGNFDAAKNAELVSAQKSLDKATDLQKTAKGKVTKNTSELEVLRTRKGENVRNFDEIEKMSNEIVTIDRNIMTAENGVRKAETSIYLANKARSITEMEMIQKSEKALRYSNSMRTAAGYMQKAGLAMGLAWFMTGSNPAKQVEAVVGGAKVAGKVGGYAVNKLFLEDHSRDALDVMIEDRTKAFIRKKKFNNELVKTQEEGKNIYKLYAMNWHDAHVKEHAQRNGVDVSKINAWIAKLPGMESVKKVVAATKKKVTGGVKEVMGAGKKLI